MRYSLIPSLLNVYEYNNARNLKDVSIFEIGKGFYKKEEYGENTKLAALMSGKYYLGIDNKIDITKAGDYKVIYSVTNSKKKTSKVKVKKGKNIIEINLPLR